MSCIGEAASTICCELELVVATTETAVPFPVSEIVKGSYLVEAAGVEPASEIEVDKERLHAQSRSEDFALRAQNGQGARNASLWISPSLPRRSDEDQPAVRRPLAAHGRSHQERQLN